MTMRPIGCPETSVRNYYYSLRNNSEECSSHTLLGGSLKSRKKYSLYTVTRHLFVKWKGGKFDIKNNIKCSETSL